MNRIQRLIAVIIAVAAGLWLTGRAVQSYALAPRQELLKKIGDVNTRLATYRTAAKDQKRVSQELQKSADRTLGGDRETVDHRLRTRLNRIGEHLQLQNVAVGTGSASRAKDSPAKSLFTGSSRKKLHDEIDYVEIEGWISGSGSFEQALRLVDAVESEPWIKRIDQLKLDPKDNGARFDVTLRLTTLFLPDRTPDPASAPPPANSNFDRYLALVQTNPFRVPPAPPPLPSKPTTDAGAIAAKPSFPYDQWALTGIAQNDTGVEVWLLNQKTRESRRLAVGESLQDVVLIAAAGETAEFRTGEQRFNVAVGKLLSDRAPVNQ